MPAHAPWVPPALVELPPLTKLTLQPAPFLGAADDAGSFTVALRGVDGSDRT